MLKHWSSMSFRIIKCWRRVEARPGRSLSSWLNRWHSIADSKWSYPMQIGLTKTRSEQSTSIARNLDPYLARPAYLMSLANSDWPIRRSQLQKTKEMVSLELPIMFRDTISTIIIIWIYWMTKPSLGRTLSKARQIIINLMINDLE